MRNLSVRLSSRALCAAAALGSTLAACEPLPEGGEEDTEEVEGNLLTPVKGRITLWEGGRVPVCIRAESGKSNADFPAARDQVIRALQDSWQKEAQVTFDFRCLTAEEQPRRVILLLKPVPNFDGVGGDAPLGVHRESRVNITYCAPSLPGANCTTQDKNGIHNVDRNEVLRATAMHEFGHVLGFVHEHKRTDTPKDVATWCDAAKPEQRKNDDTNNGFEPGGGIPLGGSYDRASIMNYCRDINGDRRPDEPWEIEADRLSEQDKRGVRQVYGPRRPNGLYQSNASPVVYSLRSERACHVMWTQYVAMGKPDITVLNPANTQLFVAAYYKGKVCLNSEVGLWTDGFFQVSNQPAIYRLRGQKACHVTWNQFLAAGQPTPRILGPDEGRRFREGFFTGALCTDAEARR